MTTKQLHGRYIDGLVIVAGGIDDEYLEDLYYIARDGTMYYIGRELVTGLYYEIVDIAEIGDNWRRAEEDEVSPEEARFILDTLEV